MSQRDSGHERKPNDLYETPPWVTRVLMQEISGGIHVIGAPSIWEPAAGNGKMASELKRLGHNVDQSDIADYGPHLDWQGDFLTAAIAPQGTSAIITNPPYSHADQFVRKALRLMEYERGLVAMLLKVDFDSGKTRRDMFMECAHFDCKIVLLDRIVWFDPPPPKPGEKKTAGPSENHAWFVWRFDRPARQTLKWSRNPEKISKAKQMEPTE